MGGGGSFPLTLATTQPAPHEPKDRSSYASLSQTCLVNTKHLLLTEITAFGLYCPLSGQAFAVSAVTPSPKGTPLKNPGL